MDWEMGVMGLEGRCRSEPEIINGLELSRGGV